MGVHPLCNVAPGVSQYAPFGGLVGPGVVQEGGHGVAAVVGGVTCGVDGLHNLSPQITVSAVAVRLPG